MIRIFLSSPDSPSAETDLAPDDRRPVLWVDRAPSLRRSWNGVRGLLGQIAAIRGKAALQPVLDRYRPAASLVLDDLTPASMPTEKAECQGLAARLDSHLTHNWAIQRPLLDTWSALLTDLLEEMPCLLAVSNVCRLDWETASVLKGMYRRFPDRAPDLCLGYAPQSWKLDDDGLYWHLRPQYATEAVLGFKLLSGTETVAGALAPPRGVEAVESMMESCQETRASRALAQAPDPLPTEVAAQAVTAMGACFRRFGFTAALRLGLDLLERAPRLDARQTATVHGILALCAHNRQFRSAGNLRIAEFLHQHLETALAVEDRPEMRCALLYRLAVTAGRRQGNLEAARQYADRMIALAEKDLAGSKAPYQQAWARNIHAYVLMREKKSPEAVRDLEDALEKIQAMPPAEAWDLVATRDVAFTQSLLVGNLAALSSLQSDRSATLGWRRVSYGLDRYDPGAERYEAGQWMATCRKFHLPEAGLNKALSGLRSARQQGDAVWFHHLLQLTADLRDRLGQAESAARSYRTAHDLRRKLFHSEWLERVELRAAAAYARTGRFGKARQMLVSALAGRDEAEMWARVHAAMAGLAARAGVTETVETSVDEALTAAEKAGSERWLTHVHATAGWSWLQLGRRSEARTHYRRALAHEATDKTKSMAVDLLESLLGLEETEGHDRSRLERCLELLPDALAEPEGWWRVRRVLGRVTDAAPSLTTETLILAARQRRDCKALLDTLLTEQPALLDRDRAARSIVSETLRAVQATSP